ncbi:hypothetical protein FIBSPDRAFT_966702 [Athelia psychrophila]|uniref:Uncharacterized protein n=1 Tax=Athelia psychrophila TaxID=1759441 RepID=A0A167WIU0_9AGAM|nr:hypothetical protein FIBSPDRAFT_966702 [Fibularhizoctonia sp. CBS 109695]
MATITTSQIIDTLKQHLNLSTPEIKEAKPQQPDIEYQPDRAKWEARTALRLAVDPSLPSTPLPAGFPKKLESPLVWEGTTSSSTPDAVVAVAVVVGQYTSGSVVTAATVARVASCVAMSLTSGSVVAVAAVTGGATVVTASPSAVGGIGRTNSQNDKTALHEYASTYNAMG